MVKGMSRRSTLVTETNLTYIVSRKQMWLRINPTMEPTTNREGIERNLL